MRSEKYIACTNLSQVLDALNEYCEPDAPAFFKLASDLGTLYYEVTECYIKSRPHDDELPEIAKVMISVDLRDGGDYWATMKAKDLLEKSGTMSLALVERNGQVILE
jgi:hypothetical protein